jgi:cell division transport system permease protein
MTIRRAMLFGPDAPGRLLPWLVAVHVCLAVLATSYAASIYEATKASRRTMAAGLTIHLPASPAPETDAARLRTALAMVGDVPGVAAASVVPEGQLRAVLEPWLGGDTALGATGLGATGLGGTGLGAVRLPTLIDVVLDPGADVDRAALAARLATVHPGVVVDAHAPPVGVGPTPRRWLVAVGGLDLVLIGLTAAAAGAAAAMALAVRSDATRLLHRLGTDDRGIAAPLIRRTAVRCTLGATLGVAGAAAVWSGLLHTGVGGAVAPASGGAAAMGLSAEAMFVTATVPVLMVLAAVLAARRTLLRRLAEDG